MAHWPHTRAMYRNTTLALSFALLSFTAARAQQSTAPPNATEQAAKPDTDLENDPEFKRLPPNQQEWVRTMSARIHTAIADKDTTALEQIGRDIDRHRAGVDVPAKPILSHTQGWCSPPPRKKPRFHLWLKRQDTANKNADAPCIPFAPQEPDSAKQ